MGGAVSIWHWPGVPSSQPRTIEELLERVVVCPSGCWLWAGGTSDGDSSVVYGRILRPGTRNAMAAHRYVHEQFIGLIPPGWQVDHLCRQWAIYPKSAGLCVNPDHLQAVPHRINYARRDRDNGREVAADRPLELTAADYSWSIEQGLVDAFEGL